MNATWYGPALISAAAIVLIVGIGFFLSWLSEIRRKGVLQKQLDTLAAAGATGPAPSLLLLAGDEKEPDWARLLIARFPRLRNTQLLFRQAGVQWTIGQFMTMSAMGAALTFMLFSLVLGPASALVLGFLVAAAPTMFLRMRKARRMAAFEAGFADAIDLLARALRAGHPLSAGFKLVADESGEPVGGEFRRVFEEQRFGMTVEESLQSLINRMDLLDVRMLVTAIMIQRDVGGNLAEVIDQLGNTIRTRFAIIGKLRAHTAQAKLSGFVLAALPFALALMLFVVNPPYILALFQEPLGRLMLTGAIFLQGLGYLWIRSIINVKY